MYTSSTDLMIDVVNISGFFSAHLFGSFVQGKKIDMLIYSYHLDYQYIVSIVF